MPIGRTTIAFSCELCILLVSRTRESLNEFGNCDLVLGFRADIEAVCVVICLYLDGERVIYSPVRSSECRVANGR